MLPYSLKLAVIFTVPGYVRGTCLWIGKKESTIPAVRKPIKYNPSASKRFDRMINLADSLGIYVILTSARVHRELVMVDLLPVRLIFLLIPNRKTGIKIAFGILSGDRAIVPAFVPGSYSTESTTSSFLTAIIRSRLN